MNCRSTFVSALVASTLTGCAMPQRPIAFDSSMRPARIGVAMTAIPPADLRVPGAGCQPCAVAANPALAAHAQTLPSGDLPKLKERIAWRLAEKGHDVVRIAEAIDLDGVVDAVRREEDQPHKNFSALRDRYRLDKLVVVDIASIGLTRGYAADLPVGDPMAWVGGAGYMVDFKTDRYVWFTRLDIAQAADGPWNEPPEFPALTHAWHKALEIGQDRLLKPFER